MKIAELSSAQMARTGCTHRFEVTYADLASTDATSLRINLTNIIARGTFVSNVAYHLITKFAGGATSDLTLQVGYDVASGTDDANGFLTEHSIHNAGTFILAGPAPVGDAATDAVDGTYGTQESTVIASLRTKLDTITRNLPKAFQEAASLTATFSATGGNLSLLQVGEVHIYARIAQL